jgi:hypothetical protein
MATRQVETLQDASDAENAAIYAYSVLGSRLTGNSLDLATKADEAHRDRRDQILELLTAAGATAPPAAVAYRLPVQVTSPASARTLALKVEVTIASVWRQALTDLTSADAGPSGLAARTLAVDALGDAADRAARWRRLATPAAAATVAFPGL